MDSTPPEIPVKLQQAFEYFDKHLRETAAWAKWDRKGRYESAVIYREKKYPAAQILSLQASLALGIITEQPDVEKPFKDLKLPVEKLNESVFSLDRLLVPTGVAAVLVGMVAAVTWGTRVGEEGVGVRLIIGLVFCWAGFVIARRRRKFLSPRENAVETTVPELKPESIPKDSGNSATKDTLFELLKLEYEKGIGRHEDIYKAVWQNFSYMSVVAGGVLTLGFNHLNPQLLPFLAFTPLIFWFLATFLPMDYYGQQVRTRLAKIEDQFTSTYFSKGSFQHFRDYARKQYRWRVSEIVGIFGTFACFCWVISAVFASSYLISTHLHPRRVDRFYSADSTILRVDAQADSVARDSIDLALVQIERFERNLQQSHSVASQARLQYLNAHIQRRLNDGLGPASK